MKILGIETSCDETALSIVSASGELKSPTFSVLNNVLYSQVEKHKEYGGVYPSLAKREHAINLVPLLSQLLNVDSRFRENDKIETDMKKHGTELKSVSANYDEIKEIFEREPELFDAFMKTVPFIKKPDVDLIAVTNGPGLEPALWVGINFARALSLVWQIPVMPTNHMEGHIVSVLNDAENIDKENIDVQFPAISLLISGGHTEIVLVKSWGEYEIIGKTKDDAVGEAYDKAARMLGLEYPGGPLISKLADEARSRNADLSDIKLPRPMINTDDFDFSFSGLKTAVLYLVKNLEKENKLDQNTKSASTLSSEIKPASTLSSEVKEKIALEFENSVAEVLFKKTNRAIEKFDAKSLIIGGGVIANKNIRETFGKLNSSDFKVLVPEIDLTTDNAIMIAMAGYLKSFREDAKINPEIKADGNLEF